MIENKHEIITRLEGIQIPRAEDLPYWTSPPIQFVYESTAPLALGSYTWSDAASPLLATRPVLPNALYFFRHITLTADISELDFTNAITTSPQFRVYRQSDANAVLFREPITMNTFYTQFDYPFWWLGTRTLDNVLGSFTGVLFQTAALVGKANITLKAIISAQEIVDSNYIELFMKDYPQVDRILGGNK